MPFPNPDTQFKAKPDGTQYVRINLMLRPDQVARLKMETNQSAAVRAALDTYFSIHEPDDDKTAAAYDQAFADMAAEPAELDEATP